MLHTREENGKIKARVKRKENIYTGTKNIANAVNRCYKMNIEKTDNSM